MYGQPSRNRPLVLSGQARMDGSIGPEWLTDPSRTRKRGSVEVTSGASGAFDAGHTIPDLACCAAPGHGHYWNVTVWVAGDLDPKTGWIRGSDTLPEALESFLRELRGRDLNEMLPGTVTSPLGIASVTIDRLALRFPRIVRCQVKCSDGTQGVVVRTPRQL